MLSLVKFIKKAISYRATKIIIKLHKYINCESFFNFFRITDLFESFKKNSKYLVII